MLSVNCRPLFSVFPRGFRWDRLLEEESGHPSPPLLCPASKPGLRAQQGAAWAAHLVQGWSLPAVASRIAMPGGPHSDFFSPFCSLKDTDEHGGWGSFLAS